MSGAGPAPQGFSVLDEVAVAVGSRVAFHRLTVAGPGGERLERDVVRHPGAVAIVPVTEDGQVVLVRQYRAPVDRELLEIPAGTLDVPGESPEAAAARELEEEVGLRPGHLEELCAFYNSPGFCDERTLLFLAQDLVPVPDRRAGAEERAMTVQRLPLVDALAVLGQEGVVDGQTLLGILLARARLADRPAPGGAPARSPSGPPRA
ncbi:NUDIX domain-containing protein [Aciditerrimonas ferrireducens]|uniref:NUDIX domain-containing protein n=1 Tax=Aciditerrimonas ferrireducens TaxID=667306 RepID=UPI0020043CAE|nr:NUDIX hydrolase [Aciditerrimonas ferrireducens]MCK4176704.1 NUDIX hydrolase [Aciditerrimonas ferrireducens]